MTHMFSSRSLFALLVLNINNFILLTLIEDDTQPIDNYDLNSKDEKNNTAAMIAASAGHQDIEKLITEYEYANKKSYC